MNQKNNILFGLLQGTYWMTYCVMFPFLVQLYSSLGYNDFIIGVIITINTVATLFAQPIWGSVCDKLTRIKPFIISVVSIGALASLLLIFAKYSIIITFISVILMAATIQSLVYIIDIWSVRLSNENTRINYAFTRSFGSTFYAITALFYGRALDRFSLNIMTPAFILCSILMILVVLFINEPKNEQQNSPHKKSNPSFFGSIKILTKNYQYLIYVISYFLISFGNSPLFSYLPRKFEILGAGNSLYGLALFIMAICEVPMLLMFHKLKARHSARLLLCISFIGMIIRSSGFAFAPTAELLALSHMFQFISFGLYIGSSLTYITEIVDSKMIFTAQTIFASFAIGGSGILGNFIGGYIARTFGVIEMMMLCIIPVTCGAFLFIASTIITQKKITTNT